MTKKYINIFDGGIMLALSYEEAQALTCLLGRVGGSPKTTPRGHCDSILYTTRMALENAEQPLRVQWNLVAVHNSLYFTEEWDGDKI